MLVITACNPASLLIMPASRNPTLVNSLGSRKGTYSAAYFIAMKAPLCCPINLSRGIASGHSTPFCA
eukprot:1708221-Ditylum_brightwellii.AAC.1